MIQSSPLAAPRTESVLPPPRVISPVFPDEDLPQIETAQEVLKRIERNKRACEIILRRMDQEFLEQSRNLLEEQEEPSKVIDRIARNFYRKIDPEFAEYETVEDAKYGELIDTSETCPVEEQGAYSKELFEAMKPLEVGDYAYELLTSNLQVNPPRPDPVGPYAQELFENVKLCPTSGYTPGKYAEELMAHVEWAPPRQPDPFTSLVGELPPPPTPSECDVPVADLLDLL